MMKIWNPLAVVHVLAVLFAFQDDPVKKEDVKKSPQPRAPNPPAEQVKPAATGEGTSAGERAVRELVEKFEKAFNEHDAKAVAALFGKDAEILNADGQETRGRTQIEHSFSAYFEDNSDVQLEIEIDSIRQLGAALIIEEGTSLLTRQDDKPREISRYSVIYSKEGDDWVMSYARDSTSDDAVGESLEQLAWLIGDWVDESSEAVVVTNYRWADNRHAIEGEFHLHAPGYPTMDGTLRIAYDPQARQLRSWTFDTEGGFASGLWSQSEDGWIVKMSGVMRDGRTTSATNSMKRQSEDHLVYQSVDRIIGEEVLPDGDEITIVRHAPAPESLSAKPVPTDSK